jgi:hypothetical protein
MCQFRYRVGASVLHVPTTCTTNADDLFAKAIKLARLNDWRLMAIIPCDRIVCEAMETQSSLVALPQPGA